ncbi:MAG: shikimate kinase [Moraxellaceae bacterium]|nr:shikimate kinase [Moraxellaceae bacterium]
MPAPALQEALLNINVLGCSGSGKSTFARRLAAALGVRYIEMDAVFWEPAWTEPTDERFFARLRDALVEGDGRWVLDGSYTRTIPIKWPLVRTVVWLDMSFGLTVWRVFWRALHRAWSGAELWPGTGNCESLGRMFSRKSIVLWAIEHHGPNRMKCEAQMRDPQYAHIRFIRLRSPREVEAFLRAVERGKPLESVLPTAVVDRAAMAHE